MTKWVVRRTVQHSMLVEAKSKSEAEDIAERAPDTDMLSDWNFDWSEIEAEPEGAAHD
jgi:hypothetical protein